jgi:hypothetical protein
MAKRFIDTGIFMDPWFMDLSKDGKILWLYFITNCNHAGILELNIKICKVQTGIANVSTVIKELGNRIVTVKEHLYFIPKFIEFQYPNFPRSGVKQQDSAIELLLKYKLIDKETLTLTRQLPNCYDNDNDNDIVNVNVNVNEEAEKINLQFETFWNLYEKKFDRERCKTKWKNLTDLERLMCIEKVPDYVRSTPDPKFRKNPATYLNNKSWNNEIITEAKSQGVYLKETEYSPDDKF